MKKLLVLATMFILAIQAVLAGTLVQTDWDNGFEGWTKVRVQGGSGNINNDVYTNDGSSYRRSCPGDFSGCGPDNKNDYLVVRDDSGVTQRFDGSVCSEDAVLMYHRRTVSTEGGDRATVQWRVAGEDWTTLEAVKNKGSWAKKTHTLVGSAGEAFEVRFWLNNGNHDYGLYDDVQIDCDMVQTNGDVPEFGGLATFAALAGAGIVIARKRK